MFVEALRYKPEGQGFESQWGHWDFSFTQSFRPHCGLAVDSVKEMSMRCLSWEQRRPVLRADNLATFLFGLSRNFGSLNLLEIRACPGLDRNCFYPFNKTLEGPKTSMNSGEEEHVCSVQESNANPSVVHPVGYQL